MVFYYQVHQNARVMGTGSIEPPFELGRQNQRELHLKPVCVSKEGPIPRLLVVDIKDVDTPRQAATIMSVADGMVIEGANLGRFCDVFVDQQSAPTAATRVQAREQLLVQFFNGTSVLISRQERKRVEDNEESTQSFFSLAQLRNQDLPGDEMVSVMRLPQSAQAETIALIKSALRLYNEVPGTHQFYASVVATVRTLIDVERVTILMRHEDTWKPLEDAEESGWGSQAFSTSLIQRVLEMQETTVVEPNSGFNPTQSQRNLQRAVASPIFDDQHKIVAILYADKRVGGEFDRPASELQASLMDIVANSVSISITRQREAEFRAKTGQFFSKSVLEMLSSQKDLLESKEAEVSILFCDIRDFSRTTHRAGPGETIEWINDILTRLSECVFEHDGVVVDYVGDAVMAMFGAPKPQTDHASRACRAAVDMLHSIPELSQRHQELVEELRLGIGINSGVARVGNIGSRIKFKYGPLGSTVNMASRIEGLTKAFDVPCLISNATRMQLASEFLTRKLAKVRVVGIPDPVEIFQLLADNSIDSRELCSSYESALRCFENRTPKESLAILNAHSQRWQDDQPAKLLISRAKVATSDANYDCVLTFERK